MESVGVTAPVGKDEAKIGEHGLYPLLSSYLWAEFGLYSKRIDEKRSSNKRGPNGMNALFGPEAKLFRMFLDQALRSSTATSVSRRVTSPGSTFPPP